MNKIRIAMLIAWFMVISNPSWTQCDASSDMRGKILRESDSSNLSNEEKLNRLFALERQLKTCGYEKDSLEALLLSKIGTIYAKGKDFERAVTYASLAIKLIHENWQSSKINHWDLYKYYFQISNFYDSLGLVNLKGAYADSCIQLSAKINEPNPYALYLLYYKVQALINAGDYHQVIEYAEWGERWSSQLPSKSDQQIYVPIYKDFQAEAYIQLGEYAQAERVLHPIFEGKSINQNSPIFRSILTHLAQAKSGLGDLEHARIIYDLTLKGDLNQGRYKDASITAGSMAFFLYDQAGHDREKAVDTYRLCLYFLDRAKKGANASEQAELKMEKLNFYACIARIKASLYQFDSAYKYYRLAFGELGQGINESSILDQGRLDLNSVTKSEYVLILLLDMADVTLSDFKTRGRMEMLEKAITIYKVSDSLINIFKTSQSNDYSKLFWRKTGRRLYSHALDACYLKSDPVQAFYFLERSRSVLLADDIKRKELWTPEEVSAQASIRREMVSLERQIKSRQATNSPSQNEQDRLFLLQNQLEKLEKKSWQKAGLNFLTDYGRGSDSLIRDRKFFNEFSFFVEFFDGDSSFFIFKAQRNNWEISRVSKQELEPLRDAYIAFLSDPAKLNQGFNDFKRIAQQLYALLFGSMDLVTGRLVVSPDGPNFPLEALMIGNSGNYLVQQCAITYTYSARYFFHKFSDDNSKASPNFLGIAPVNFASGTGLPSLLESDVSIKKISKHFARSEDLLGSNAKRSALLNDFSKFWIIQLYAHAIDSGNMSEPNIYLSDSILYLSDLMDAGKTSTRLVVLSACETGSGKLFQGEGVFSFNRAFAALGVPACITNFWSVDNEATYQLTENFYNYLAAGELSDVALQKAKIDFINSSNGEKKLPAYWAGCVLTGKTEKFYFEKKLNILKLTAISLLVLFTVVIIWRITVRK